MKSLRAGESWSWPNKVLQPKAHRAFRRLPNSVAVKPSGDSRKSEAQKTGCFVNSKLGGVRMVARKAT